MKLYLDLDSFFVSVERSVRPGLGEMPVAVVPGADLRGSAVIAVCARARAAGVAKGMAVDRAKRLCPGIVFLAQRPDRYVRAHHEVVSAVASVLPVEAVYSIDEVAAELAVGDDPWVVGRAVKAAVGRALGPAVTASVGVAPTRWLAKVGASMGKPDGLRVLRAEDLPGPLLALELCDLPGIGPRMEVRLAAAGVRNVEGLWGLSRSALRSVWGGVHGARLWSVLHGVEVCPVATERRSLAHGRVLAPDRRAMERAYPVSRYLVVRVARRLRREGRVAKRLWLDVEFEGGGSISGSARSGGEDDDRGCLRLHGGVWRALVENHCGSRVLRMWVSVDCVGAVEGAQADLFADPQALGKARALSGAVDGLRERYGRSVIGFGRCGDGSDRYVGSKIAYGRIPEVEDFWC